MKAICKHFILLISVIFFSHTAYSKDVCSIVELSNPEIKVDQAALEVLANSKLTVDDFYKTLRVVSKYETGGCWAGATGNSDGQILSAGVMQWNFNQGSLQPLLKRFIEKFSSHSHFESVLKTLMPNYGSQFLDISCRSIPIKKKCKDFLLSNMIGKNYALKKDFKKELDALFNDPVMRQIQIDYFARAVTSVIYDLARVYATTNPAPWQVAWAVDVKTQQGDKFPTDKNIKKIREQIDTLSIEERSKRIYGVIKWYDGLCDSGTSEGIKYDCAYNIKIWPAMIKLSIEDKERESTVHYTHLIARTAQNANGAYQGDAFQRRATIAFGKGSVHSTVYDFQNP